MLKDVAERKHRTTIEGSWKFRASTSVHICPDVIGWEVCGAAGVAGLVVGTSEDCASWQLQSGRIPGEGGRRVGGRWQVRRETWQ